MDLNSKIYVAGHSGLVGSAIVRNLKAKGFNHLLFRTHSELDLCDAQAVRSFFEEEKPEYVFVAAAQVGGILANATYPAEFIRNNLAIEENIIHSAYESGVKKLLFLGSSCIYPRDCPQPIKEEYLMSGPLETTNEWYAIAKIAGLKLCQAYSKQYGARFISLMPTNLYGPRDNFDPETSHVAPALIRKFVEAKEQNAPHVVLWGTGSPRREFLYVDDLAEAALWAMEEYEENQWLNIGTGEDVTILELAHLISELVGYSGKIVFDTEKPDGTPRKLLDVSKINERGWRAETDLRSGLKKAIAWYLENRA